VALPTPPADERALSAPAQDLPQQFIDARVQFRRAEARQAEITRRLKLSLPVEEQDSLRKELSEKILEINSLNAQIKSIQERANQLSVTLPSLTPEQEAVLAGTTVEVAQPDPLRAIVTAWEASINFLRTTLTVVLGAVVFLWWMIPLFALAAYLAIRSQRLRPALARRRTAMPGGPGPESTTPAP
jgi:hypothetical protein